MFCWLWVRIASLGFTVEAFGASKAVGAFGIRAFIGVSGF